MRSIDYFDKGAERNPERAALVCGDKTYSFREARALSFRIAAALETQGLAWQEPVALYAPNDASVMLCLLGLWRAGAVWVPVNTRNAVDANAQYMNYVRTGWLFYHSSLRDEVAQFRARVSTLKHLVCLDRRDGDVPSLEDFIATGLGREPTDRSDPFGQPDEVVGIFPTGGTTGPSKGVNVTNRGWGTMLEIAGNLWQGAGAEPVCLAIAPLTHAAGPMSMATLSLGATNVIMQGFDAGEVLHHIARHRVTHMYLPPTALYGLLDHPDLGRHDYSSLKYFLLVGSPVSPDKLKRAVEVFGPCLCQCYGQVEAPMLMTWLPPEVVAAAAAGDHPERLRSCGKPTYPVVMAAMDEQGRVLPRGERGELVVRGALVSHSYFGLPQATAEVRTHGWHHTGDVGYLDDHGYVFIVDRKKDMIITGGFNVFSAEVEASVLELPAVKECAVIGVPDAKWGEAIKAVVVRARDAQLDEATVMAHCKARLGSVKAPKTVEFWDDIPKTPANKADKKAIRSRYWTGSDRNVH